MDEPPADGLLAFALGTFHAALLVVALVLLLHSGGALAAGILGALDTLSGLAVFAALWAASVFAMRQAIVKKTPAGSLALRGVTWGGAVGALFLVSVLVIFSARSGRFEPQVVILAAFGAIFAATVGGLVGLAFVAIDGLISAAVTREK